MKTIRRGSTGEEVRTLQAALAALGFAPGAADGIFGLRTEAALRAYQAARGLGADGIAGPLTWAALAKDGYLTHGAGGASPSGTPASEGGGGPAPAAPLAPIRLPAETNAAMTAAYGAPSASPDYLDWFSFPGGARLYSRSGQPLERHRCHRLVAARLTAALAEIHGLLGHEEYQRQGWHVYGGCHNYRPVRGGSRLSTHAWGVAVDLNPAENGLHSTRTTFSAPAIDVMERHGFLSGGRAWGRDWMHFQAVVPSVSAGSHYARHGLPQHISRL